VSPAVVVVGSLNADLVVRTPRFPAPGETTTGSDFAVYPGGKGANQAVAAARLGAGVIMVGRVGRDDHGRLLRRSLAAAGVDAEPVVDDEDAATGVAVITIDASGQNHIVLAPGANERLRPGDIERRRALIESAAVVLLQLEVPLETVEAAARIAQRAGVAVVLDPAPARREALALLPLASFVTPNETELRLLAGAAPGAATPEGAAQMARSLLEQGARCVIAKLGAAGAIAVSRDGEWAWPGHPVQAVDTTAAGDAWNGAFAVAVAEGRALQEAGAFASAAAAISVTRPGAQPSMATRDEVERFRALEEKT
jgi:ribokinase